MLKSLQKLKETPNAFYLVPFLTTLQFSRSPWGGPSILTLKVIDHFVSDNPAPEATLRGTEYITYDLQQKFMEPILSINDEISLHFKTRKSSGLLFYTGK